jgi:hypothetical protein
MRAEREERIRWRRRKSRRWTPFNAENRETRLITAGPAHRVRALEREREREGGGR